MHIDYGVKVRQPNEWGVLADVEMRIAVTEGAGPFLLVRGITIRERKDGSGSFASMPARKRTSPDGTAQWEDYVVIPSRAARNKWQEKVLAAYHAEKEKQEGGGGEKSVEEGEW